MELNGTIKEIMKTQEFDSGFTKREFVVTTQETYPQDIKLELIKDKCSMLDSYSVGDPVGVQFNLRGNEYNGKYYVNLQAWRIEKGDIQDTSNAPAQDLGEEGDDLPF